MKVRTIVDHDTHFLTIEITPETTIDRDALEPAGTQTEAKLKKNGSLLIMIELKKQAIGRADTAGAAQRLSRKGQNEETEEAEG